MTPRDPRGGRRAPRWFQVPIVAMLTAAPTLLPAQDPPPQTPLPQKDRRSDDRQREIERARDQRIDAPGGAAFFDEAVEALAAIEPARGIEPRHVRVLWLGDGRTEATISWTTREAGADHRVTMRVDTDGQGGESGPDGESGERTIEATRNGRYTKAPGEGDVDGASYHHAMVDGLEPGTTYAFEVRSDGEVSRTFRFCTAADEDSTFTLLAGGDSRSNALDRCRVNLLIRALTAENDELLAFVHSGDYIATGWSWAQWEAWLDHHELTTTADGRILPLVPARGNHDRGALYGQVFAAPATDGVDAAFTTRLGAETAVVTLNTNIEAGGEQVAFLERELTRLRPEVTWLLVNYHRAMYPAVKSPSPAKALWVPLFERFRIDLALEGDGHALKRTLRIRFDEPDPDGVVYVGEGGLGVGQRRPRTDRWYFGTSGDDRGMAGRGHHVMVLDVSPDALRYRSMLLDRSVADEATFTPRAVAVGGG